MRTVENASQEWRWIFDTRRSGRTWLLWLGRRASRLPRPLFEADRLLVNVTKTAIVRGHIALFQRLGWHGTVRTRIDVTRLASHAGKVRIQVGLFPSCRTNFPVLGALFHLDAVFDQQVKFRRKVWLFDALDQVVNSLGKFTGTRLDGILGRLGLLFIGVSLALGHFSVDGEWFFCRIVSGQDNKRLDNSHGSTCLDYRRSRPWPLCTARRRRSSDQPTQWLVATRSPILPTKCQWWSRRPCHLEP